MTRTGPIRVLVIDDSAFARKVVRECLSRSPAVEVVGIARDGLDALEQIVDLKPDVVTLDLIMPNLDGLGVMRALPRFPNPPRVVIVSISNSESDLVVEALRLGAVDLVHKPTALASDRLYELADDLIAKVTAAAESRFPTAAPASTAPPRAVAAPGRRGVQLVVIGTSTGGPQALTRLLTALPAELPCAVAVALHIPAGYTEALARRLNGDAAISVVEAAPGAPLPAGTAAIARGGLHLAVERGPSGLIMRVGAEPTGTPFCPSVDVLFESAARLGPAALGVVLTGMGSDGVAGARAIREAGGRVLTEAEASCVVYGMPRAVKEAGLSDGEAEIDQMAARIAEQI
ncbi:MAG TPA: chemotaxis-specific protein-glutamate methyltransferase CheB [Polyangia bacterium]|nr:chemotaxis-specific protein-glutamate methyltransferase CheB [Polyangia bacterium]